jgi:N utilization substance protein B
MTRRELRTHTFKLLYRTFFYNSEEMKEQERLFFEDSELAIDMYDMNYVQTRVDDVISKLDKIDETIDSKAESWKVNRMNYVDLTIIRLAFYEINYDDDIPMAVAINEAVELAKIYGGDESASFVNGVLAKLL